MFVRIITSDCFPDSFSPPPLAAVRSPPSFVTPSLAVSKSNSSEWALLPLLVGLETSAAIGGGGGLGWLVITETACLGLRLRLLLLFDLGELFREDLADGCFLLLTVELPELSFLPRCRVCKMVDAVCEELADAAVGGDPVGFLDSERVDLRANKVLILGESRPLPLSVVSAVFLGDVDDFFPSS